MELLKDFLRQYWLNMVAFAIFVAALIRYVQLAQWEQELVPFVVAFFGFVCVIASEEVSDWTGRYGWTRQQWRQYPRRCRAVCGRRRFGGRHSHALPQLAVQLVLRSVRSLLHVPRTARVRKCELLDGKATDIHVRRDAFLKRVVPHGSHFSMLRAQHVFARASCSTACDGHGCPSYQCARRHRPEVVSAVRRTSMSVGTPS